MQKAPVLKSSGLAPIDDEAVHVFGRNLEDRVVSREEEEEEQSKSQVVEEQKDEDVETIKKRKFETITGEEDEETVFQGDFKLFVWDITTSNWIEKGRGQLKLNDSLDAKGSKSRLIMRTGGTFRIVLNVAIQHSFFKVINISKTSIRFTDSRTVWAASGSNARQLGDLIDERLEIAAEQAKREKKEKRVVNEKNSDESTDEKYVEIEHRPPDEPDVKVNEVESDYEEEEKDEEDDKDEEEEEVEKEKNVEKSEKSEELGETTKTQDNENTKQEKVVGETESAEEAKETVDSQEEKLVNKVETKEEEDAKSEEESEETEKNREEPEGESKKLKLSSS